MLIDQDKLSEVHSLATLQGCTSLIWLVWRVTPMAVTWPPNVDSLASFMLPNEAAGIDPVPRNILQHV